MTDALVRLVELDRVSGVMTMTLALFGSFDCRDASGASVILPTRKAEALLAYLAMNRHRPQTREKLAALIWDEKSEDKARMNLRKTLSRTRQSLAGDLADCLVVSASHLSLCRDRVFVDVAQFEELVAAGTPDSLERAVQIGQTLFLEGFSSLNETFDEWLAEERRRLEELARGALKRLLDHYVVCGVIDPAIQIALRLLTLDALDESVHRTLIRLYLYQDRIGSAAKQYEACKTLLARELGVDPAPETQTLYAELLRQLPEEQDRFAAPESDTVPERAQLLAAAIRNRARTRETLAQRSSIAVLPFKVLGDNGLEPHLGESFAEDLITELGRFREFDVISPTSVFAYRGAPMISDRMGNELGARFVFEGTLRAQGARLRITTRLIDSASARQLWAERYDCAREALFEIQDDLVRQVISTLVGQVEQARLEETKRKRPEDWLAYDLWLRGRSALRDGGLGSLSRAREFFQQAIEQDPNFARAYVGLAAVQMRVWTCYSWNHWAFLQEEALALARKAVMLDERDHHALCMLSMAHLYSGNYDAGRQQISKALELNPNDCDVLAHAAVAYPLIGDLQAGVEAGRSALRLSPHHPEWYVSFAGFALLAARHYEEAIETLAPAPEAICDTPAYLAVSHAYLGRLNETKAYRDTLYRHLGNQVAQGDFPQNMSCAEWLLAMAPFRRAEDTDHYREGIRLAGIT